MCEVVNTGVNDVRISIKGDLTINHVSAIYKKLREVCMKDGLIELDLSGITDCDTSGVQIIYSFIKSVTACGGKVVTVGNTTKFVEAGVRIGFGCIS